MSFTNQNNVTSDMFADWRHMSAFLLIQYFLYLMFEMPLFVIFLKCLSIVEKCAKESND